MKKRIRVHEARIGMFVHELEHCSSEEPAPSGRFLILSGEELGRVFSSRALSLLIDTEKGIDIAPASRHAHVEKRERERLLRSFSPRELEQAERTLAEATPLVRNIVAEARMSGVTRLEHATLAVDQIMLAARDNAAALIAMSRLKDRDEVTYLHSLAVSALITCFGRRLGFDETAVRELALGGLLHDIGKTVIPIAILAKTGSLTPAELALIRTHPRQGFEMLQRIDGVPRTVLDICLHHHERYDGQGYPDGLAGEAIPLVARMAAICDVYEAMTTVRPYKRAWSQRETIDMMRASKGHFDLALFRAFLSQLADTCRL